MDIPSFYIVVTIVALIVFIVLLTVIGVFLNTSKSNGTSFPTIANKCPDRWALDNQGNCVIPANSVNVGTFSATNSNINTPGLNASSGLINMNDPGWSGVKTALCSQQAWANQLGIVWDGVTNNNTC